VTLYATANCKPKVIHQLTVHSASNPLNIYIIIA
jgi:hypothetical protein